MDTFIKQQPTKIAIGFPRIYGILHILEEHKDSVYLAGYEIVMNAVKAQRVGSYYFDNYIGMPAPNCEIKFGTYRIDSVLLASNINNDICFFIIPHIERAHSHQVYPWRDISRNCKRLRKFREYIPDMKIIIISYCIITPKSKFKTFNDFNKL